MGAPHRRTEAATTDAAATRVHGLVHVVDPGPVRGPGGARTRAAGPARVLALAPTRRAHAAARAATAAPGHALGTEVLS